jgi:sulfite reductase alpha subunit-like flavoprotein
MQRISRPDQLHRPPAAQDVAERAAREAAHQLYAPRVMPMDVYDDIAKLAAEPLVIFVTSTTGQVRRARLHWLMVPQAAPGAGSRTNGASTPAASSRGKCPTTPAGSGGS